VFPDKKTLLFTKSYNEYYNIVFSTAYYRLGDVDAARDVCQEVFTRFLAKMDEAENCRRWLLSALKFVILEYLRKNSMITVDISEINDDINLSFVNGFDDSRIVIEETLNNMEIFGDEKTKTMFDLIAIYHYTYKETGAELGMSERQIKYKYRKTIDKIVDHLKSKGIRSLEDLV
jgi:RNA polymerase sigma factor (sigma-70 family)